MAVLEQTPYKEYVGNGVTTNFALGFTCDLKQELKVFINDIEPGLSTWSLVGGSVVFTTAPVSGSKIVLKRATKLERTTNYLSSNNSFRPEAINKDLDRVWYALQDQAYKLGQYDLDYSYAINTSNQALSDAATAQQKADSAYNLADTINTETRPIERGGTGATTAAGARINIGVYSQAEVDALIATGGAGSVVGIAGGGTGATTAAGARTNLDVMSSSEVATAISNATPPASTTQQGLIQIATQAEVNAGANGEKAIVPNTLSGGVRSLLNVSGSAPMYACRAWVNFNGAPLNGTYSQAGTTVTVTMTAHGMSVGQKVNLTITSGTAVSGSYTVATVPNANTFTYTAATDLTTSGNVTRNTFVRASGNVSSITDNGVGDYIVNFTSAMQDTNYSAEITGNAVANGTNFTYLTEHVSGGSLSRTSTSIRVISTASAGGQGGATDHITVNVSIFR